MEGMSEWSVPDTPFPLRKVGASELVGAVGISPTNFAANVDVVRGALNGAAWLPGLLLLEGGVLSLVTDRGTEFSCSVAEVSLAKSSLGSLTVRSGDAEYKLSFIGGRAVPAPSAAMNSRVRAFKDAHPDAVKVSAVDPVSQLTKVLEDAGVRSEGRQRTGAMKLLLGLMGVCIFAAVVLIVAAGFADR